YRARLRARQRAADQERTGAVAHDPEKRVVGEDQRVVQCALGCGQMFLSAFHSAAVSSSGPLPEPASLLIMASRSLLSGCDDSSVMSLWPSVMRTSSSPIALGERPSLRMTSAAKASAARSWSRE